MEMLKRKWILYILILVELLVATTACPSGTCAIINCTDTSLAMQVINCLKTRQQNNGSFTFYIWPGTYNATNGTESNFYNFSNITLQKDPQFSDGEVIIQCPYLTDVGDHNGLAFNNGTDISIIGLTFTKCGQKTFGSYFENVNSLYIIDSIFRHNLNNGLGILSGTNVSVINCTFENNVGLQNDSTKLLRQQETTIYGGASLGISLQDTINTSITVENCTFKNNVALKNISNGTNDSRPYNDIPFGNGGGIYINLHSVRDVTVRIRNCHFYNNTALHQGGGIVIYMTASYGNVLKVIDCEFTENKAIGYPLFNKIKRPISDYDKFIEEINSNFSIQNFSASLRDALFQVSLDTVLETGGFGAALTVNFLRDSEHNKILIKSSTFKENLAIGAAGIGIFMQESFSSATKGVNTNRVWISGYVYM